MIFKNYQIYSHSCFPGVCVVTLFLVIISIASLTGIKPPAKNETGVYAFVFSPANSFEDNVQRVLSANATPVRSGIYRNIIVVTTKDPDFKQNALDQGAWLVIDPVFAGACNPRKLQPKPFTKDI